MDTSDSSPPNIAISPSEVSFLNLLLEGEVQHYRALVELSNLNETAHKSEEGANRQPLVERLNEYPAKGVDLKNLVSYPPKLEPVPVKPLFFDAAWNYIEYPGRELERIAENGAKGGEKAASAEQTAQQKKGGWFGFGR
jgi:signal recognition particle subunit SRP68